MNRTSSLFLGTLLLAPLIAGAQDAQAAKKAQLKTSVDKVSPSVEMAVA